MGVHTVTTITIACRIISPANMALYCTPLCTALTETFECKIHICHTLYLFITVCGSDSALYISLLYVVLLILTSTVYIATGLY